jgi:hypothetical protein
MAAPLENKGGSGLSQICRGKPTILTLLKLFSSHQDTSPYSGEISTQSRINNIGSPTSVIKQVNVILFIGAQESIQAINDFFIRLRPPEIQMNLLTKGFSWYIIHINHIELI